MGREIVDPIEFSAVLDDDAESSLAFSRLEARIDREELSNFRYHSRLYTCFLTFPLLFSRYFACISLYSTADRNNAKYVCIFIRNQNRELVNGFSVTHLKVYIS